MADHDFTPTVPRFALTWQEDTDEGIRRTVAFCCELDFHDGNGERPVKVEWGSLADFQAFMEYGGHVLELVAPWLEGEAFGSCPTCWNPIEGMPYSEVFCPYCQTHVTLTALVTDEDKDESG